MNQEQHEAYWRGYNDAKKYEQMKPAREWREWWGLTDEEIEAQLGPFPKYASEWDEDDFRRYSRAIETKLREKNTPQQSKGDA